MPFQRFEVYNKSELVYKPPFSRQIRRLPDGSKGIVFRGKVYLLFNDIIDISKNSFKIKDCPLITSKQILNKDKFSEEDFYLSEDEYNPKFYFNGLKSDINSFLYFLEKKKN